MPAFHKFLMLAAGAGMVMLTFASDTSASTMTVQANISFAQPISAQKESDVSFGEISALPNDTVTMDPEGNMRLKGNGEILSAYGHPSVINLGDSRNQVMNFVSGNYVPGQGIAKLQAHCQLKGAGNCDHQPIYGQKQNTLFVGMDMTVAADTAADNNEDNEPSFDMSVVYQ